MKCPACSREVETTSVRTYFSTDTVVVGHFTAEVDGEYCEYSNTIKDSVRHDNLPEDSVEPPLLPAPIEEIPPLQVGEPEPILVDPAAD